jgi:hypothetical protein
MHKKLVIAHSWLSDQASISATSEVGSLPAVNLIRSQYPTDAWRSLGSPGLIRVRMHLPEVEWLGWNLVAPLFTNSSAVGTWQVIAAPTEAQLASPTFEGAVLPCRPVPAMDRPGEPDWRHALSWLGEANVRTEPWVEIIWDDPEPVVPAGITSPFVQWGRVYVTLGWQPSYHRSKGAELTPANERGRRVTTQGGGTRVGPASRPRRYRFNVGFLTREEMLTKGYELDRIVGTTRDLLVIEDPEDPVHLHKGMIYGTLPEPGVERHEEYNTYSRQYQIEEMIA